MPSNERSANISKSVPDISELITRCRDGDWDAFTIIYSLYWDRIYAYCYSKLLRNHIDAEEVAQNTFVDLWRAIKRGEILNLLGLIYSIARREIVNKNRSRRRSGRSLKSEDEIPSQIEEITQSDQKEEMLWVCQLLNDIERRIVKMHIEDGKTFKEIGIILDNMDLSKVFRIYTVAVKKIRKRIKP